jgi:hypothetical protein
MIQLFVLYEILGEIQVIKLAQGNFCKFKQDIGQSSKKEKLQTLDYRVKSAMVPLKQLFL